MTTTPGIDVSRWQGAIDWPAVAATGCAFAVVRSTIGSIYKDPRCFENVEAACAAGLLVGVYHVVRPDATAADQFANLSTMLEELPRLSLPVVLDVELPTPAGSTPQHLATLQHTRELLRLLPQPAVIYTGAWWWDPAARGADVSWALQADLWIASYTPDPRLPVGPWPSWTFWQKSSSGSVAGIAGPVDINLFAGDIQTLRAYAVGTCGRIPEPPPPTTHTITVIGHNVSIQVV